MLFGVDGMMRQPRRLRTCGLYEPLTRFFGSLRICCEKQQILFCFVDRIATILREAKKISVFLDDIRLMVLFFSV